MLKWVVAIVLVAMLLTHGSPWAGGPLVVSVPHFDGGGVIAAIAVLGALLLGGFILFSMLAALIGGALMLVLALPLLLVFGVLALVFAPILLPFVLVLMLIGACLKGIGLALAA